ncbi:MAG: flagellar motor protein MotA [Verrucomicrobiales bacterium]|nr:flagellar motor protein MotA [Verrucomicrobiales bacterium]
MVIFIGFIIIMGGTLGGFMAEGGNPLHLLHIGEIITILGMLFGCAIIMAPVSVLKGISSGIIDILKGAPYNKEDYEDLFKMMYELFQLGRRNGMIALEDHVMNPKDSSLFKKYDKFHKNDRAVDFFCDGLRPLVDGRLKPEQIGPLMDSGVKHVEHEKHAPVHVLHLVADSMPAFGIVAAVMGIIKTMGVIDSTELVAKYMAAALSGTFLGIFISYGVVNPLAVNLHFYNDGETTYLKVVKASVVAFALGLPPIVACEIGRREIEHRFQPSADDLEKMLKSAK